MKTIGGSLLSHIQGTTVTICTCWKITRKDGVVMGFTDNAEDLVISGVTYKAKTGYTRTAIASSLDLSVDNMQLEGVIDDSDIEEADLSAGLYDNAEIEIFITNFEDLTMGVMTLKYGNFGELTLKDKTYVAEFRGLSQKLSREIGDIYTPDCRFDLYDSNCTISPTGGNTIQDIAVDDLSDPNPYVFGCGDLTDPVTAGASWVGGFVEWKTGSNADTKSEIKAFNSGTQQITLYLPTNYPIKDGDEFNIYVGCDKKASTCKDVFNNILNFGGFLFMPSVRFVLNYPDAIMSAIAGQNDGADD